ncbi:NAD-dependent epimerase/dehydratase family protein [Cytophagaceae bacterium DM2B3-1]|uniref:NAD-dependent epimerase/dehydratase family protein n=1 Tax=Xanthocytophaga flava TaxID=3048013 RepID=A0ABT7CDD7_9BACT|nr:NAD-dependent epimerase/dehydratase family protein [Xanthocytophaga flavus]MDJ1491714.1 NAD-dependent epimerase/dehydratase family protein [Xanthocytophaga flavus]
MRILIIGACGFIGISAVRYFIQKGYDVSGCDVVYYPNHPIAPTDFTIIDSSHSDFSIALRKETFDFCLNASGAAHVGLSFANPLEDYRLNTYNVFNILEAIRLYNPTCKFVNLSSAAVYGDPQYLPINESHPLSPLSPYGWHKVQSENICREYVELFGAQACNLRIFSAYGPGLQKQLFWDLYQKARKSTSITLFGSGKESRDFIYIEDLLYAIECVLQNGQFKGEAINIANGKEITIEMAASIFYKEWNPSIEINFSGEHKPGDPVNWCADITRLISMDYKQQVSFESGIKHYIEWLKERK